MLSQNTLDIHVSKDQNKKVILKSYNICDVITTKDSSLVLMGDSILFNVLPKDISNELFFHNFNFRLRHVEKIKKLKLILSGYINKEGALEDKTVLLSNGSLPLTGNMANKNMKGKRWPEDTQSNKWIYYFDMDSQFYENINSLDFGAKIILQNKSTDTVQVVIKDVIIEIEYYPIVSVCENEIITFYTDFIGDGYVFNWELPEGAYITSPEPNDYIINVIFTNNNYGIEKINLTAEKDLLVRSGSKKIIYNDCRISKISGNIWIDENCNNLYDSLDAGLDSLNVAFFSEDEYFVNQTDSNGYFRFDSIISNYYNLKFLLGDKYSLVYTNLPLKDSNIIETEVFVSPAVIIDTFNFGITRNISLEGEVFEDFNANMIQDSIETVGVSNVSLVLKGLSGDIKSVISDSLGKYKFDNIGPGKYKMCISDDVEWHINKSVENCRDISLQCGQKIEVENIGIFGNGQINGNVWIDSNGNGLRDTFETKISGILIELIDASLEVINSNVSDSTGYYSFENILPGEYKIKLKLPDEFGSTILNIGDKWIDNDFYMEDSMAYTKWILIQSRDTKSNIDCGFIYKKASIGDFVWLDENGNNVQDTSELGISGIKIQLLDKDSIELMEVISSDSLETKGKYIFRDLEPGKYYIKVILPQEYIFVNENNVNDKLNSDIKAQSGISRPIELKTGENNMNIDIGLRYNYGKIESFVWLDDNENGLQDINEEAIDGIGLLLENAETHEMVSKKISQDTGKVIFKDIISGKYHIVIDSISSKYILTDYKIGQNQSIDSDFKIEGNKYYSSVFDIESGEIVSDIDLGLKYNFSTISGFVWNDINGNGVYEIGEELLENMAIEIYDINKSIDIPIKTILSDQSGSYRFTGLKESIYFIKFDGGGQYHASQVFGQDNKITGNNGLATTDSILLSWGSNLTDVNGAFITNKSSIGDFVWLDDNNNGLQDDGEKGIEKVFVRLFDSQDSLIKEVVTNELGQYLISDIDSGYYYLQFVCDSIYSFTIPYLTSDKGSKVINTGYTGVTNSFHLEQGTQNMDFDAGVVVNFSSIGDAIWLDTNKNGIYETEEKGLDSIRIEMVNVQNNTAREVYSKDGGYFKFDSLIAGYYYLRISELPDTLDFSGSFGLKTDFTDENGQNTTSIFYINPGTENNDFDIALKHKTGIIGDRIWLDTNENGIQDSGEGGINGVKIILYNIRGEGLVQTTTSDLNGEAGHYNFEVERGEYFLRFILPYELKSTIGKQGINDEIDSDLTGSNGYNTTGMINILPGQINLDIDVGLIYKKASIGGWVWEDINKNGILDTSEPKLDHIKVYLHGQGREVIDSTWTSSYLNDKGRYGFDNLIPGNYYLVFDIPDKYVVTEPNAGPDKSKDSDITGYYNSGSTDIFTVYPDENSLEYSAGFVQETESIIGGRVWLDKDANGIMDSLEYGMNGVEVRLYKLNGVLEDKTLTKTDSSTGLKGIYRFVNIPQDTYYIQFINQIGYFFTEYGVGKNDSLDSDVNSIIEFGSTDTIFINGFVDLRNINAGLILDNHSVIGDRVWEDINGNGVQDNGEPGINGVLVRLYKEGEGVVDYFVTRTDEDTGQGGYYKFDNLLSGKYYVEINLPGNFHLTDPLKGIDTNLDSDISDENGINTSPTIELGVNEIRNDIDIGAFKLGQVGDYVWIDDNENGIQDPQESGKQNIFISIYNEDGEYLTTAISDNDGKYLTDLVRPGKYFIKVLGYSKFSFTIGRKGENSLLDSDITNENGDATSSLFQLESGEIKKDIDVGILAGVHTNMITFPNPVKDFLTLTFNTQESENVIIYLKGMNNEKVKEINLVSNTGTNIINVDISDLKVGFYRVLLRFDNEIKDKKTILKVE